MQYFEEYPKIVYDLVGRGDYKVVTDLLRRVKVRDGVKNNVSLFDKYNVKDGETPEQVSNKFYNSEDYWWVVLLMNNVKDRYYDWPLSTVQFQNYMKSKYALRLLQIVYSIGLHILRPVGCLNQVQTKCQLQMVFST